MQRSLGRIESTVTNTDKQLQDHIVADMAAYSRITALETDKFKQMGAARVWALLGTAAGSVLGFVATFFGSHR
jgi:hypothetical protein